MLAVVSVIANHLAGWPVGGFVGVDVFFVISGFLITGLLVREHERTGRISFADFYRRRVKRLMPAALLVLAATVTAAAFLLPQPRALSATIDAAFAALFTVNWRLAAVGTDYFAAGQAPSPLQHYWSLSVEEQFYIVWPIVMVLVLWLAARLGRDGAGRRRVLFGSAALISIASFAWAMHETATAPDMAYFSTFARAWELGVGAILAIVVQTTRLRIPAPLAPWAALAGTAGIVLSCFVVLPTPGFPAPSGLLPVLSTALVIWAGVEGGAAYERVNALLTNRASQFLGDISYSLYLWHFPVIIFGQALLPADSPALHGLALVVTLLLSWASYRFVEDPARRSTWLTSRWRWRPRVVVGWAAAAAVVLTGGVAVTSELTRPAEAVAPTHVAADVDCFGAAYLANGCSPEDLTGEVAPAIDVMAEDTGGAYACWRVKGGELETCTYGAQGADATRVALVGDSHAAMLMPGLLPQLEAQGWRMDTYLGYGCQWRDGAAASDCADVMAQVDERLSSGEYDLIITSAARWASDDSSAESSAAAWGRALDAGTRVVAVADVPTVSEETLACIQRVSGDPADCATPLAEASQPADPLVSAAALEPRAALVEVADRYCVGDACPGVIGGVIVYRDAVSHTTGTYMRTLGPELVDRIRSAAGL